MPQAVVLAGLLELPAEALAELVTDRLLEVPLVHFFGAMLQVWGLGFGV